MKSRDSIVFICYTETSPPGTSALLENISCPHSERAHLALTVKAPVIPRPGPASPARVPQVPRSFWSSVHRWPWASPTPQVFGKIWSELQHQGLGWLTGPPPPCLHPLAFSFYRLSSRHSGQRIVLIQLGCRDNSHRPRHLGVGRAGQTGNKQSVTQFTN